MPIVHIIAGPNGAGKTTGAMVLLPKYLAVREFINADLIAKGLSPFDPDAAAVRAGRLMLERIRELVEAGSDFAFETTLSSRTFAKDIPKWQARGYRVQISFIALESAELSRERVKLRVSRGGHNIPDEAVARRFDRGRRNFVELYMPLADTWGLYDNTFGKLRPVAEGGKDETDRIYDLEFWENFYESND